MKGTTVCITGAGIVSAIGFGKEETLQALRQGRSGIAPIRYLETTHADEFPSGEVKADTPSLRRRLGMQDGNRTTLLGILAIQEALQQAGITDTRTVSLLSGTTVGGMEETEQHYAEALKHPGTTISIRTHHCGATTDAMAAFFGGFRHTATLSTACSSAANAILRAAEMIQSGRTDICIAGGSECLSKFHLNGFNSLMILDRRPCRPFDAGRAGLNLGEGAGFLVLESEVSARRRKAAVLGWLNGYGNACDAFHQTASSPEGEGAFLAMRQALEMAGLTPADIDYINAHGTGTPNNDASESRAVLRLFGGNYPPISSTKAFTGHTTSASGGIEAVICLLALQEQFLPQNLHFSEPMEGGLLPVQDQQPKRPVRHVLCNAFAFGGNDTSLLLSNQPV
ncbi:MAG: beta-ketoacyl-[acyl-carrier-protein] synthase family protein [Paludibacteraceae bacterium]|nr:beta-ketoacyl-[acyl-carrier-protein] synthase family protein [Paludibacteraceae bacterium]